MMATLCSLQLVRLAAVQDDYAHSSSVPIWRSKARVSRHILQVSGWGITRNLRAASSVEGGAWCGRLWDHVRMFSNVNPHVEAVQLQVSASSNFPGEQEIKKAAFMLMNYGAQLLRRTASLVQLCPPLVVQTAPALGLMVFSVWGLEPTMRLLRSTVFKRSDRKWEKSRTQNIMSSYMRPILLWIGIIVICRALDPVVLATEASHAIKTRFVNFVRSLSTVVAFAYCTASLTQQVQKFMMENQDTEDARNVGVQFIGNTVYTSVWVAAVCLFMELLGFSTQKWITAGGFGTVLLTLAGREIFTNFLSSIMIHATRPFVDNEWIQTKIEGQEVSGTVEHVGWWSPTVIRGDDREAVHIPNHKFSVSVVRNLSQKTHWRIKTHLGISHLDVNKITDIVRDMRRVLSKHPQVEQQRLHRRVFFDNVDPENQALLILVSCFVKTSHFEEYLRVKEVILLDLLKIISHHKARLATPIRSVQRILDENEARAAPFRDMNAAANARRRPYLLEMSRRAMGDDDDEEEDDEDISDDISRLSAELAKAAKAATPGKGEEIVGSSEDVTNLKDTVSNPKPKESVSVGGEVSVTARTSPLPSALQSDLIPVSSSDISSQESTRTHMDKSSVVNSGSSTKITLEQSVSTSHELTTDHVIEEPVDPFPALYSNNVGLDDLSVQANQSAMPESMDHAFDKESIQADGSSKSVNTDIGPEDRSTQSGGSTVSVSTDDPWKHSSDSHVGLDAGVVHTGGNTMLASTNISLDGKSVQPGSSAVPTSTDDPWRQSSDSHLDAGVVHTGGSTKHASTNVGLDEKSVQPGGSAVPTSTDDPWRQSSDLNVHESKRSQPRPPIVDKNLVIGIPIDGPKHTLPLDDEIMSPGDTRTLVALGTSSSSKEKRETSTHTGPGGAGSSETRDRER